jgi:hypothetical protein
MIKNEFDKKRRIAILCYAVFVAISAAVLFIMPGTFVASFMVLCSIAGGIGTAVYARSLREKSKAFEKKRLTPQQKLRQRLLDKERGKVIEFPSPYQAANGRQQKK